jgi:hypothetical protein
MKKISLSQLFCYSFIGFSSMITLPLPSFFLINPALGSNVIDHNELNNLAQNQQIVTPQTIIPNNIIAQTPSSTPQEVQDRLAGQWELQGWLGTSINVVITAQGRGFVLPNRLLFYGFQSNPIAYEFSYQLNNTTQPMQVDIVQPMDKPIKTIFEFTNDGRLRVEIMGIKAGESRPTEFTIGALFLSRVSNITTLPRNTEIANSLEARVRSKEDEGRSNINLILRVQQAYFLEKETFTTDIEKLGLLFEDNESNNYTYQMRGSLQQAVLVTATAKVAGLRSFAGVVFVVKEGDTNTFKTEICETIEPSMESPSSPLLLNREEIICAPGSRTPEEVGGSRYSGFYNFEF